MAENLVEIFIESVDVGRPPQVGLSKAISEMAPFSMKCADKLRINDTVALMWACSAQIVA